MLQSAGERDRLIKIMAPVVTHNERNEPITNWNEIADTYASWRRATANERLASGQVNAGVTDVFEMLWSEIVAAADPKYRVLYAGRNYDIIEVTEIGFREGLLIRASAKADGKP